MTYAIEAEQLVKHYAGRGGDVEGVDLHGRRSVEGFAVVAGAGALMVLLSVRSIRRYD
jgi:hypothetical protein